MMENQFFWLFLSFILTIMIFSFIFGDNPLFRIATYFFIGVSSAYVLVLLVYQVVIPKLLLPLFSGGLNQRLLQFIPLLLSTLLIFKLFRKTNQIGNISLAILVGGGAAIILTSAFTGTILPMMNMVTDPFSFSSLSIQNFFSGIFLVLGVTSSLIYFQMSSLKENSSFQIPSKIKTITQYIGVIFIGISLGSVFAGVIISSAIALFERINFVINFLYSLIIG